MKQITEPCKVDEGKYMFTEGINYFETGKESIWGKGDKKTLEIIDKEDIKGDWLHLAAGDGRYNLELLVKANSVTATDVDKSALSKLWYNTPKEYQSKLRIKAFNLINKFPFNNNSFDGVFCTGTLHLFPKGLLKNIFGEMDRVLKSNGKTIIDFATDARRIRLDTGEPYTIKTRADYSHKEAKIFLKDIFKNYKLNMYESEVVEEFQGAHPAYKLNCKFIILVANK